MSTTRAVKVETPRLDNLTLSRKEGWRAYVQAPKRPRPEALTRTQIRRLGEAAADIYNQRRADWHNNLLFRTPQLRAVHDNLWPLLDASTQDGHHAKTAIALDGYPGLGKTLAVETFARQFHDREIRRHGEYTDAGDERWPVCRIGMRGNTSMKDFNAALCDFYAHPIKRSGTTEQLGQQALDDVLSCETRLLIIDDLHFLHWQHHGGIAINNHFKYIANEFPVTLLYIGIGLTQRGVLMEDMRCSLEDADLQDVLLQQTTRRTILLDMQPFGLDTEHQRRQWHQLLATIEDHLVLGTKRPGMLADELGEYLYERSTGHIGSLMELVRIGCAHAVHSGSEALTKKLFDSFKIDSAAEKARRELAAAFRTRKLSAKIRPRPRTASTAPR